MSCGLGRARRRRAAATEAAMMGGWLLVIVAPRQKRLLKGELWVHALPGEKKTLCYATPRGGFFSLSGTVCYIPLRNSYVGPF